MKTKLFALLLIALLVIGCLAGCKQPPEDPFDSENPDVNVDDPSTPDLPDEPEEPDTPTEPETPTGPEAPTGPGSSDEPEEPELYTITWVVDGKTVTEDYLPGDTPSFSGSTAKAPDSQYIYTFSGWSPALTKVTANATYTAQYSKVANEYTVTWVVNGAKTTQKYKYGDMPSYTGALTKPSDSQYTYTFLKWDKTISKVTSDITYTAEFSKKEISQFTITWYIDGATTTSKVAAGARPSYAGATPTKGNAPDGYTYKFKGWSVSPSGTVLSLFPLATSSTTYYAVFELAAKQLTATWYINGSTTTSSFDSGSNPYYPGSTPTKTGYYFSGWKNMLTQQTYSSAQTLPVATADVYYEALFTSATANRSVAFIFNDGIDVVLYSTTVTSTAYSIPVTASSLQLTVTGNALTGYVYTYTTPQYIYTITGFKSSDGTSYPLSTTGSTTYFPLSTTTASTVFTAYGSSRVPNPAVNNVTATFKTYDGASTIHTSSIAKGSIPVAPSAPVRAGYTFKGWALTPNATTTITLSAINSNTTYYAVYALAQSTITWKDGTTTLGTTTVPTGTVPTYSAPAKQGFTFKGWATSATGTPLTTLPAATGNATYYAIYEDTSKITITWNYNGASNVITQTKDSNNVVPVPAAPSVPDYSDSTKVYKFDYWTINGDATGTKYGPNYVALPATVNADVTFTAHYAAYTKFTVTWMNGATTFATVTLIEGDLITAPASAPTKAMTSTSYYSFLGWAATADGEVISSFGEARNVTFHTVFHREGAPFTVCWIVGNNEPSVQYYRPGDTVSIPSNPIAPEGYTFKGWAESEGGEIVTPVTSATSANTTVNYYAVFEEIVTEPETPAGGSEGSEGSEPTGDPA